MALLSASVDLLKEDRSLLLKSVNDCGFELCNHESGCVVESRGIGVDMSAVKAEKGDVLDITDASTIVCFMEIVNDSFIFTLDEIKKNKGDKVRVHYVSANASEDIEDHWMLTMGCCYEGDTPVESV